MTDQLSNNIDRGKRIREVIEGIHDSSTIIQNNKGNQSNTGRKQKHNEQEGFENKQLTLSNNKNPDEVKFLIISNEQKLVQATNLQRNQQLEVSELQHNTSR